MQLVLLAMTILSMEIFFHGLQKKPKQWHGPICIAMIPTAPVFATLLAMVDGDLHIAQFYGWAIVIVSLAGMINYVRWERRREPNCPR